RGAPSRHDRYLRIAAVRDTQALAMLSSHQHDRGHGGAPMMMTASTRWRSLGNPRRFQRLVDVASAGGRDWRSRNRSFIQLTGPGPTRRIATGRPTLRTPRATWQ